MPEKKGHSVTFIKAPQWPTVLAALWSGFAFLCILHQQNIFSAINFKLSQNIKEFAYSLEKRIMHALFFQSPISI